MQPDKAPIATAKFEDPEGIHGLTDFLAYRYPSNLMDIDPDAGLIKFYGEEPGPILVKTVKDYGGAWV